ncbi:MAG TPA: antibiotic biosynthesis monooxygenase [Chitinophagaceae bacterium]
MFARLTFTKILPQHIALHRKIFTEEVVPAVRRHKGLIHIMLLEPTQKGDEFISVTEWESQKDAEAYERSGQYQELIQKINGLTAKEPALKTYTVETVGATRPEVHRPLY